MKHLPTHHTIISCIFYVLQRSIVQIKKCWNNIKCKRKSEITAHKQAVLRTGGGPVVPNLSDNPEIDQFANIACEIPNVYDSDTIAASNVTCKVATDGQLEFNLEPSDHIISSE